MSKCLQTTVNEKHFFCVCVFVGVYDRACAHVCVCVCVCLRLFMSILIPLSLCSMLCVFFANCVCVVVSGLSVTSFRCVFVCVSLSVCVVVSGLSVTSFRCVCVCVCVCVFVCVCLCCAVVCCGVWLFVF